MRSNFGGRIKTLAARGGAGGAALEPMYETHQRFIHAQPALEFFQSVCRCATTFVYVGT